MYGGSNARTVEQLIDFIISKRIKNSSTNCWEWIGEYRGGYGVIYYNNKRHAIHRFMAFVCLGFDLNSNLCVLHKCDNRSCFNPLHLFIGTLHDNMMDMVRKGRGRKKGKSNRKTHCVHGHEFTPENSYFSPKGIRLCVACQKKHSLSRRGLLNASQT